MANYIDPILVPLLEPETWTILQTLVEEFSSANFDFLKRRRDLQAQVDEFHKSASASATASATASAQQPSYVNFLKSISYITPPPPPFSVSTQNIHEELLIPAPQLVVPVDSARFAINAANARYGNLFDAIYGSNIIPKNSDEPHVVRANRVFSYVNAFLDEIFPLSNLSWADLTIDAITSDFLSSNSITLKTISQSQSHLLLNHNKLNIIIKIDATSPTGILHKCGIDSVNMEAALTVILDMEDSVSAVDAEDKFQVYSNLFGLFDGTLSCAVRGAQRKMHEPNAHGLPQTSLLLVRNVGMHMSIDFVTHNSEPIPEAFLDLVMTVAAALKNKTQTYAKSIYVVKPKLHGAEEVAFTVKLFERCEELFGLERNTIKIGIMDEERRTSVNLAACIWEARERVFFINTGFLDRTGSEIHSSMYAGPMMPKKQIEGATWRLEYEKQNVDIGLETNLNKCGQIGKGMWAVPDDMLNLLKTKGGDLEAGGSTAWVPSPTGAVIHSIHYHLRNATLAQARIKAIRSRDNDEKDGSLLKLLTPPIANVASLTADVVSEEAKTAVQAILGYVARWIDKGVGCSKVPDLAGVGKMEDRATLRISAQLLINWLHWGIIRIEALEAMFSDLAKVVEEQNNGEVKLGEGELAREAAMSLVLDAGKDDEYTEKILHRFRKKYKISENL